MKKVCDTINSGWDAVIGRDFHDAKTATPVMTSRISDIRLFKITSPGDRQGKSLTYRSGKVDYRSLGYPGTGLAGNGLWIPPVCTKI